MLFLSCKSGDFALKGKHAEEKKYVYKTISECKYPPYKGDKKQINDLSFLDASNFNKNTDNLKDKEKLNKTFEGYRIYLKYPKGITEEKARSNKCNYFWNMVFYHYSEEEQIDILSELLSFRDDTDMAGIKVYRYKESDIPEPKTEDYTIQTDALYLFTNLVMGGYTPNYCPFPVLIDTESGEEINNDQDKIKEVFDIYTEWLRGYKKNGTKDLRVPLYGSKYQWYGSTTNNKQGIDFDNLILDAINNFPNLPSLDTMYF